MGDTAIPVPDRFTEKGEPPVVTLTGLHPPGGIEVAGGTVRVRFVEHAGTVTTEVTDPPAPPDNKPLVTVRRRTDGAPDVTVSGGRARVLILDPGDPRRGRTDRDGRRRRDGRSCGVQVWPGVRRLARPGAPA